jgi:hypothetical protein
LPKLTRPHRAQPDAVYLHPNRRDVIYRIYRLLDHQQLDLLQFLLSEATPPPTPPPKCPLPILPSKDNRQRVDPEMPIETTGIFRDPWDRRLRSLWDGDARTKNVIDLFSYLSFEDWRAAMVRGRRSRRLRKRTGESGPRR